ncbi:MAG: hypothetical protein K0U37_03110 [Gammaproteobacteria bacterium]|nr:hypothetical protein [Gammaproteobacteria bacterium]
MPLTSIPELDLNLSSFRFNKKSAKAFQENINKQVVALNNAIDLYNDPDPKLDKAKILEPIVLSLQTLRETEPDLVLLVAIVNRYQAFCEDILGKLADEIRAEKALEAARVMKQRRVDALAAPKTLSELVEGMSHDDVKSLTHVLMNSNSKTTLKSNLRALYPLDHPKGVDFEVFLMTHEVGIIPSSNSKLFSVTTLDTNEKQVLKVEYLAQRGQAAELYLREHAELSGVFTPIFARKKVTYYHPGRDRLVQGNLVVTEFCEGNNVETHGKDFGNDDEARLRGAADIYTQMSDILIKIEAAGCAFPDMKVTNWLVDSSGKLRVADGKSFMFTNASREIRATEIDSCVRSPYLSAPEQWQDTVNISADKMHAYILGRNLYFYLTRGDDDLLYNGNIPKMDASELDFSFPIFQTPAGAQYKALIEDTHKARPANRLSVAAFHTRIEAIHASYEQEKAEAQSVIETSQEYREKMSQVRDATESDRLEDDEIRPSKQ